MKRSHGVRWLYVTTILTVGFVTASAGAQPAPSGAPPQAPTPAPALAEQAPPRPLAESLTGIAKAEHRAGVALFEEGDYAGAIARFEQAYTLSHDHRLLWNILLCQKNLRSYVALVGTLRRMEQEAAAVLTAEERKDLEDLRAAAESFVSRIEIVVDEPGATVLLDGVAVGTTPLPEPLLVDVGERTLKISKPGFKEFTRPLRVVGGGRVGLAVMLVKDAPRGQLTILAGATDLISVDGRMVGRGRWEGQVRPGPHALQIRAPRMVEHRSEVLVRDRESRRVEVALKQAARPDSPAVWLWVAGGAALLTGAAISGALLFEPKRPTDVGTLGSYPLWLGR